MTLQEIILYIDENTHFIKWKDYHNASYIINFINSRKHEELDLEGLPLDTIHFILDRAIATDGESLANDAKAYVLLRDGVLDTEENPWLDYFSAKNELNQELSY